MMQAEYRREDHKTYFVVKDTRINEYEKNDGDVAYDLEMLCENRIKGLLPISVRSFNGETELYYDISTKQTMSVLYDKKKLLKEDLTWIFSGIKNAVKELEDFFLDMECVILDMDYVYINMAKREVLLLYYPYPEESFEENVEHFAEAILDKICNEDQETVIYAYNFYRFVKEEKCDLIAVFERMDECREEGNDLSGKNPVEKASVEDNLFGGDLVRKNLIINNLTKEDLSQDLSPNDLDSFNRIDLVGNSNNLIPEDSALYLENDEPDFAVDDSSTKNPLTVRRKRIFLFGFLGLFGIGIMAFAAWRYNLSIYELGSNKEGIVGSLIVVSSILGFAFFEICDIRSKKKKSIKDDSKEMKNGTGKDILGAPLKSDNVSGWEYEEENYYGDPIGDTSGPSAVNIPKAEEEDCATVLLQENCYTEQRILVGRIRGRQRQIDLSSFPFVIGKNKEQADYVIEDSSISRLHARFTLRDDIVYLTDLNSTNGSMKNGIRIQPNELVELQAGDEIKFGRVTFTYQ